MAQYAIVFDLDTAAMKADGFSQSDVTKVYQTEIPDALAGCGFTAHPYDTLYHTPTDCNSITAIMELQGALSTNAPNFCRYAKRVHVFRIEELSNVTCLIV